MVKRIKEWWENKKLWWEFKHSTLTPKGIAFLEYCSKVVQDELEYEIQAYEEKLIVLSESSGLCRKACAQVYIEVLSQLI